jgi:phosphate transport system ATP-binding protein
VSETDAFALVTRGLNLWYGTFQALMDVSIKIRPRLITSLIGPSGCGKTTLLRCFNRVNERYGYVRTTGEIAILGRNIYAPDISLVELRKAVGMVFQRPNPLPISVYENVVLGLRLHSHGGELERSRLDAAVEAALTQVGLWKDLKDRLHAIATGLQLEQQQKLCIARLLPLKPEVILMDEPCSALDVEGTRAIEELRGLRSSYHSSFTTWRRPPRERRVHLHAARRDDRTRPDQDIFNPWDEPRPTSKDDTDSHARRIRPRPSFPVVVLPIRGRVTTGEQRLPA